MRILILGGDGYLGWPTAMRFSARGHDVFVVDNFSRRRWHHEHGRSEEHTSELQSRQYLVCRLLLEKKKRLGPPRLPSRIYFPPSHRLDPPICRFPSLLSRPRLITHSPPHLAYESLTIACPFSILLL